MQGRTTCKMTGRLCPGISIGCALCAILSPDTCGAVCPIAGLYCGTAAFACAEEKKDEEEEEGDDHDRDKLKDWLKIQSVILVFQ